MTERRDDNGPDHEVRRLLNALATPAALNRPLPGERAALEAFREQHLAGRRRRDGVRIRRSVGAVAAGVGLFLTSGTAAAAATGVLPDPAQHMAHTWFERVGISVPDSGGFLERSITEHQRGVELPDQARLSVTPPSVEDLEALRPTDQVSGAPARPGDSGTREKQAHGAPSATYSPPSPAPVGHGSTQQPTVPPAPAPPPATPAGPPSDPHAAPPAHPNTTPPANPADQAQDNSQDRRRDPVKPTTPAPTGAAAPEASPAAQSGAASAEAPPAAQTDFDPTSEETTQRRPR